MSGLTKVFVGNLAFSTKEAELAEAFSVAGKVVSANIITRGPRSLGYGFVEFESTEAAQNAVKTMDKKEVQGRQVNVELAKPQEELKKEENKEARPAKAGRGGARGGRGGARGGRGSARGGRGARKTYSRRNAEETSPAQGEKAEKQNAERPPKPVKQPNENREESQTTLFVANLPFSLDDAAFGKFVGDLGLKFKSAHVVTKRNGRSKGYGFVEFENREDQQKALQVIDKKEVEGRPLSVKVALTEPEKKEDEKEEKKEEKKAEPKPATKETKKDEKPATKEVKKEEKPAAKEAKKEEKKEAKPAQVEKKANAPAKEAQSPQQKK